jgi:hypothetical protein
LTAATAVLHQACEIDEVDTPENRAAGGVAGTGVMTWGEVGAAMLEKVRFMENFFSYRIDRVSPFHRAVMVSIKFNFVSTNHSSENSD